MGFPVRPSGYVGWGSTGMTNVTEPTDAQKAYGWATNQQPPSSYFNWLHSKQDEWLQYLDWKSQLRPIISDDFLYQEGAWVNDGGGTGIVGSTSYPKWEIYTAGANAGNGSVSPNTNNFEPPSMGCFQVAAANISGALLGQGRITANVRNLYGRDFRMDAIARQIGWGATASSVEIGFFNASGTATGNNIFMGFEWTGASGVISAAWTPSGAAAPTSISLGVIPSGWQKLTIESRSPTMVFYVNDTALGVAPAVMFGASGAVKTFGVRALSYTGLTGIVMLVDALDLSIRPV